MRSAFKGLLFGVALGMFLWAILMLEFAIRTPYW